ncbi:MAG: hypothetical protein KC731_02055 [Myxococcales bacterium]|nr:hypothetical protein [Myxococcales bacterium]
MALTIGCPAPPPPTPAPRPVATPTPQLSAPFERGPWRVTSLSGPERPLLDHAGGRPEKLPLRLGSADGDSRIREIAITRDGTLVATASKDGLRLWRAQDGAMLAHLQLTSVLREASAHRLVLAFTPDGNTLLAAGHCALWRFDLRGTEPLAALPFQPTWPPSDQAPCHDELLGLAIAPEGDLAAMTSDRALLRRFLLTTAEELPPVQLADPAPWGFSFLEPAVVGPGGLVAHAYAGRAIILARDATTPKLRIDLGVAHLLDLRFVPGPHPQLVLLTEEDLVRVDVARGSIAATRPFPGQWALGRLLDDGHHLWVVRNDELRPYATDTLTPIAPLISGVSEISKLLTLSDGYFTREAEPSGSVELLALPSPR